MTLPRGLNSGPESPLCPIDSGSPVTPMRWKQAVVCCAPHPQPSQRHRLQPTALGLSCWVVPRCHQQLCSQYVLNCALESVLCPIPVTIADLWDPEHRTMALSPSEHPQPGISSYCNHLQDVSDPDTATPHFRVNNTKTPKANGWTLVCSQTNSGSKKIK